MRACMLNQIQDSHQNIVLHRNINTDIPILRQQNSTRCRVVTELTSALLCVPLARQIDLIRVACSGNISYK